MSLQVTNLKIKFLSFYFWGTNSKFKNKKEHTELLTRNQKIKKKILRVTNSIVKLFLFHFRVTNSKLENKVTLWVINSKLKNI